MIDSKALKKAIGAPLEAAEFIRKGESWYYDGEDAIIVVNRQKSGWDRRYYLNLGIYLKSLGSESFPQYNQCHLYYRVDSLFPEDRDLILVACSLEDSNDVMLTQLSEFIADRLVPYLLLCTAEATLKEMLSQGTLDRGFVRLEARWRLSE